MLRAFDYLKQIAEGPSAPEHRASAVCGFARDLEWTPSYEFTNNFGVDDVEDHLIVEHGIENAAVITFLRGTRLPADLSAENLQSLLTLSYNNLIPWHFFVSESQVRLVNNLTKPLREDINPLSRSNISIISGETFDSYVSKLNIKTNLPACDDALITVISRWKRLLKADYTYALRNKNISALLNSIIFIRACEDDKGLRGDTNLQILRQEIAKVAEGTVDLIEVFMSVLRKLHVRGGLEKFVDVASLAPFRDIDAATANNLIRDFYRPHNGPYQFNFALMSKHALSRIYERYVSLLRFEEEEQDQKSFFPAVPSEKSVAKTGSVYTPQFIAGFFARYVRDNMTPRKFRTASVFDPACGSGIFLRTLLELKCNPFSPGFSPQMIRDAFNTVVAIDVDPNASEATRLSLSLLHLALTGSLPGRLHVHTGDAIEEALSGSASSNKYTVIVTNPPYVKLDHLPPQTRDVYIQYLKLVRPGRIDSYLAFIKLCMDKIEDDGFICLVLPHSFLLNKSGRPHRDRISEDFLIRCLVDISDVQVFEGLGIYNVLLILQKKSKHESADVPAQIIKARDFVGMALQACLDNTVTENKYFAVYNVPQARFRKREWVLLRPSELRITDRFQHFRPLSEFMDVRQGFVTGKDDVFIRDKGTIPQGERVIFIPYLRDRQIGRFRIPKDLKKVVFYPYLNGEPISEQVLRTRFKQTWKYLVSHKTKLAARGAVQSGDTPWWRPSRPRNPETMLRPKIVCPHLMLTPRFALDLQGRVAISHSPFLVAKNIEEEMTQLKYFCAVLNSSAAHWFITRHSHKYSRGYALLEVATLKNLPVPDPSRIPAEILRRLVSQVDKCLRFGLSSTIDDQIDGIVANLYGLTDNEQRVILGRY